MDEKDILQLKTNITKNVINIQSTLLHRNYNFPDYEYDTENLGKLEQVIGQLEQLFGLDRELVNKILGGGMEDPSSYFKPEVAVPLYLHIDVIIGIIERGLTSTTKLEPEKKALISRLEALREKAETLPYDEFFDSKKKLSDLTIDSIVRSRGSFSYKKQTVKGEQYLAVDATHTHESYDYRNGDVYDYSAETYSVNDLAFEEDRKHVAALERQEKEKIMANAREVLGKYFKDGVMPSSPREVRDQLNELQLNDELQTRVFLLADTLLGFQIDTKKVANYTKELKEVEERLEAAKKEEETKKEPVVEEKPKKGLFERFKGIFGKTPAKETSEEDIEKFEAARKKQIARDEEVRDVIIYQRKIIGGKEVLVPMDQSEFKVVRR